MGICGRLRADRANDVDLLRRVRDVVLTTDDVSDLVPHVFHGRGEVVRRTAVRAHEDDILQLIVRELDAAANSIVPGGDTLVRHAETDRALVLVSLALLDEPACDLGAVVEAVELKRDIAVPVEPEPAQRLLDLLRRLFDLATRIRVLDAKTELAALVTGEEPVEERGPDVPDVQEAGWARSHADADGHAVRLLRCCSELTVREESRRRSATGSRWAPRRSSCSCKALGPGVSRPTTRRISRPSGRSARKRRSPCSSTLSTSSTLLRRTTRSTRRASRRCRRPSTQPARSRRTGSSSTSARISAPVSTSASNGLCRRSSRCSSAATNARGSSWRTRPAPAERSDARWTSSC